MKIIDTTYYEGNVDKNDLTDILDMYIDKDVEIWLTYINSYCFILQTS